MAHDDPDYPLVIALQKGDATALDELIRRHKEPLMRFIYRCVPHEADARDLAQESFVRSYFAITKFHPRARFKTWLYQIAVNLCRDYGRRQRRQKLDYAGLPNEAEARTVQMASSTQDNPATEVSKHESFRILRNTIHELPAELKEALVLTAFEGLSHQECGEIMGCTSKAVESRVYRAKLMLRDRLKKRL